MKQCTGCGRYDNEPLGLNKNGEPYLACCPDNNYIEVRPMKLYTEEQVKKGFSQYGNMSVINAKNIIDLFITPIQLPSDEEMANASNHCKDGQVKVGFLRGVLWYQEQILNQNK